jgi:hypothetical protein
MIAIGAIKEAFRLSWKNKILQWLSFALLVVFFLLERALRITNVYLVEYLPEILYFIFGEIILIVAVQLSYSDKKIVAQNVQTALRKYSMKVFFLLITNIFFILIYSVVFIFVEILLGREISKSNFIIITFLAFPLVYLLPYYFSIRFIVLQNVTILSSIAKSLKLYLRRFFDTIIFSSFITLSSISAIGFTLFLSFGASSLLGHQIRPLENITSLIARPLSPFGIFLALIFLSFSALLGSSSVTIYFKKLDKLGEFDG